MTNEPYKIDPNHSTPVYIVEVKWVAEMRPMKLYERTKFYFFRSTEAKEFMNVVRGSGHECFIAQDVIMNPETAYSALKIEIETTRDGLV